LLTVAVAVGAPVATASGQGPDKAPVFEKDVLPILTAHCLKCHGDKKREGELDLRTPATVLRGGESGAAVIKGAPDKSLLVEKIATGAMPPGSSKLSKEQVNLIRAWIRANAPASKPYEPLNPTTTGKDREHWAFQPPSRPHVPAIVNKDRMRTPIDAFLLARLEAKGLTFAPDAAPETLLRRAYLDFTGLPPTPEEIDAFLADGRPDAFEYLIDRLLASPRFGERWGRHWLDVVGYADTVGFDIDSNLIIMAEGKWRYRDYVIAAFNKDLPFDQFVREQIAGDELVDWRRAAKFTTAMRDSLIATGFLRNARDESHEPESNIPLVYYGVLHNTVDIVGNSLLGLTLQCARCHNHKFDPISQKEYYQLMAFLTPAYNPKDWRPVYPWKAEIKDRGLPDVSPAEHAEIVGHNRKIDEEEAKTKQKLTDINAPVEARLRQAKLQTLPAQIRDDVQTALATAAGKRTEIQKYLANKFEATLRVSTEETTAALSATDRTAVAKLKERMTELQKGRRSFGKIQALYDVGPPPATLFLKRGDHETPGEPVAPGFPTVLSNPSHPLPTQVKVEGTSGRRLALARWLTEPDSRASGLLARVMVNRLWQHLHGRGLVPTPENFGRSGDAPTHPELLEWLGSEFTRAGWRVKPMLKLMMTSTAYRQASRLPATIAAGAEKADPGNKLLWKARLRRLDAEAIRDSIFALGGRLDLTMGGPPVKTKSLADAMVVVDEGSVATPTAKNRRSVYLLFRRAYNLSLLSVFDLPVVAVNCSRRDTSAVPLQSLTMMNDAAVAEQASFLAERVKRLAGGTGDKAVATAFRVTLARAPTPAETAICSQFLDRQARAFREAKCSPQEADHKALVQLCHTLLNTSEFLYLE
jgi:cytochrome c553